ncbi:uncharacterized protein A1O5_00799 [Cladophialophora psammophila CBS 110553]|uniref:3-hydroxyisobutyrate dehydrogenase n=1 Tax=Cladophialophora psammophila CBS 110553 TaxID=1182543 RepID=W9XH65_9EURO|nr:uncharacterized protein A1O5_00799 [Cladophialophora psammophila CBS 110553]EXJ76291.1 hypothetical protein A1O5_00799 [Cladophialophora psammophila CBS 110553]
MAPQSTNTNGIAATNNTATNGTATNGASYHSVRFIGLGLAGWPVATNLPRNGFRVHVFDVDGSKSQRFAEEYDCTAVSSPADGFKDVDILIAMLPNGAIIAIDAPITQRKLHDTDVSKVAIMIGAKNADIVQKVMPVMETLSKYCFVMGGIGSSHAMKTINNYVMASSICALADSFIMGSKFGLHPGTMLDVLNAGTGRMFASENTMRDERLMRRTTQDFSWLCSSRTREFANIWQTGHSSTHSCLPC